MINEESATTHIRHVEEQNREARAELLSEVAEKAQGEHRQAEAQTLRAAEILKEELNQKMDEKTKH
ncbi:hypothetical protein [Kamptonema sp. UHCC 0994]|uniref:hypothetical protein n=1 Tax=Kamptonema sp. UHCC 0994 TaxID=3031329 RepID=UPI0023B8A0DB|nr:hypothetical protein [Kamptonema sp. UHCC 0994]MDF0556035.1 hypothetical protein [Kamptonema sp. UHCC 0994]